MCKPVLRNAVKWAQPTGISMLYLYGGADRGGPQRAELVGNGVDLEAKVYAGATHPLRGADDFWPDIERWLGSILGG